ncbi:MAG: hypothetical protein ACRC7S_09850 [Cetobacterium sp.]
MEKKIGVNDVLLELKKLGVKVVENEDLEKIKDYFGEDDDADKK